MKKRVISILLSLIMLLSILPLGAFAASADGITEYGRLYVEAGAYIDTGIKPTENTRVVMDVEVNGAYEYWFGVWDADYNSWAFALGNDGTGLYAGYGFQGGTSGSVVSNGRHTVELDDRGNVKVDSVGLRYIASSLYDLHNTLYLFAQNRKGHASCNEKQGVITFYSCQIYENNTLVRDFVPAKRGDDIGVYDRCEKKFYEKRGGADMSVDSESDITFHEWLQVEKGAYIDTGYKPTNYTSVVMDVNVNGKCEYWFGAWDESWNKAAFAFGNDKTGIYSGYGNEGGTYGSVVPNGRHTVELDKWFVKVDDEVVKTHRRIIYNDYDKFDDYEEGEEEYGYNDDNERVFPLKNSLYLFAQNRSGAAVWHNEQSTITFYSCKIYEDGTLVRDLVPAERGATAGVYDRCEGRFYAKSGSGAMTAMDSPKSDVVEYDWLAADAGSYIDTGIKPTDKTRVIMSLNVNAEQEYWFGAWDTNYNKGAYAFCNDTSRYNTGTYIGYGNDGGTVGMKVYNGQHTVELRDGAAYVDGSKNTRDMAKSEFSLKNNLYLFAQNRNGSAYWIPDQRITFYYCKIYEGEKLVRDFVPAKKGNVSGLYDKCEGKFYANSGNGGMAALTNQTSFLDRIDAAGKYVDTGYRPNQSSRVVMDVEVIGATECWFGVSENNKGFLLSDEPIMSYKGFAYFGTSPYISQNLLFDYSRQKIELDKGVIKSNGSKVNGSAAMTSAPFSMTNSLYLFARNENGKAYAPNGQKKIRFYSCRIYDGDKIVRSFVPAEKDGVTGLYDICGEMFYELRPTPANNFPVVINSNTRISDCVYDLNGSSVSSVFEITGNVTEVTFDNVVFKNISCPDNGSCVYVSEYLSNDVKINFNNCQFINCSASYGGAIYVSGTGHRVELNFNNTAANNCYASNQGGFAYIHGDNTYIYGNGTSVIYGCSSYNEGGAFYINYGKKLDGFSFVCNESKRNDGGALLVTRSGFSVSNCAFYENYAYDNAGAIYVKSSTSDVEISDSFFYHNYEGNANGGISLDICSDTVVKNCDFVHDYSASIDYLVNHTANLTNYTNISEDKHTLKKSGDGKYYINNSGDWFAFQLDVCRGKTFEKETVMLGADVFAYKPVGSWADKEKDRKPFKGTFDGNAHSVTICVINDQNNNAVFSHTAGATINNLSVCGYLTGGLTVAGVVANSENTCINGCTNYANISGIAYLGGIAGYVGNGTTVINCINYGTVRDGSCIGGIVGRACSTDDRILNCINYGDVIAVYEVAGGIVGETFGDVYNCYCGECALSATIDFGRIFGKKPSGNVEQCYFGDVFIKRMNYNIENPSLYFDGGVNGWLYWRKENGRVVFGPKEATGNRLYVKNSAELDRIIENINNGNTYANYTIVLEADIAMPLNTIIGDSSHPFKGTFDGNGFAITVTQKSAESGYIGLFGYTDGAVFKNITVKGESGNGHGAYMGALVGYAVNTSFIDCENRANVWSQDSGLVIISIGGFAGYAKNCTFENCSNYGAIGNQVKATAVGGIVGLASASTFINCVNYEKIRSGAGSVGGIIGYASSSSVRDGENHAEVTGTKDIGGIVGYQYEGTVYACKNSSYIGGGNYVGGIIGRSFGEAKIERTENSGEINGSGDYVGGIVGKTEINGNTNRSASVRFAVNRANVTGKDYVGGIVGSADKNGAGIYGSVNYAYVESTGDDPNVAGGIVGMTEVSVQHCANHGAVIGRNGGGICGVYQETFAAYCVDTGTTNGCDALYKYVEKNVDPEYAYGIYCDPENNDRVIRRLNSASGTNGITVWGMDEENNLVPTLVHGFGTEAHPYEIATSYDLELLGHAVDQNTKFVTEGGTKYYRITKDIYDTDGYDTYNFSGRISPIGNEKYPFNGVIDGGSHTVFVRLNKPDDDNVGLFGVTNNAVIKNIRIAGGVNGKENVGGIAGKISGTVIVNCMNDARITARKYAAGFVGSISGSTSYIINCVNRGEISADDYAAGIAAKTENNAVSFIERCFSAGVVEVSGKTSVSDAVASFDFDAKYTYDTDEEQRKTNTVITDSYILSDFCNAESMNESIEYVSLDDDFTQLLAGLSLTHGTKELLDTYGITLYTPGFVSLYTFDYIYFYATSYYDELYDGEYEEYDDYEWEDGDDEFEVIFPWLKEFSPAVRLEPVADACYLGVEPTTDKAGHKEYFYNMLTEGYYTDIDCYTEIPNPTTWATNFTGNGYLAKLDEAKCYKINDKLFEKKSYAEAYLENHYDDGITYISLAGNITTQHPVYLFEGTALTVDMNGYDWIYEGTDLAECIFKSYADNASLVINGNTPEIIENVKNRLDSLTNQVNVYVDGDYKKYVEETGGTDEPRMGMIYLKKGFHARLLGCNSADAELNYVYVKGTNAETDGGMIRANGKLSLTMNCSIAEDCCSAAGSGGAIYEASRPTDGSTGKIELIHSAFVNCYTYGGRGGAIYMSLLDNSAESKGGIARTITGDSTSGFWYCHSVDNAGGAIAIDSKYIVADVDISKLYFCECYVGNSNEMPVLKIKPDNALSGGAIYLNYVYGFEIANCDFSFCLAGGRGGAIAVIGELAWDKKAQVLTNLRIKDCEAVNEGKDIYFESGSGVMENIALICKAGSPLKGKDEKSRIYLLHNENVTNTDSGTTGILFRNVGIETGRGLSTSSIISVGSIAAIIVIAAAAAVKTVVLVKKKKKVSSDSKDGD